MSVKGYLTPSLAFVAAIAFAGAAAAQGHVIGGLRIADETGAAVGVLPAPPGEKYYQLDAGTTSYYIAFDFSGASPVEVELRVLGPMGTVVFKHTATYSEPGTQVVRVDSPVPLEDNEYVVNAYVGPEWYLADSLQLAVGAAQIPGSKIEESAGTPVAAQATMVPVEQTPANAATPIPGGPHRGVLVAAGALLVILLAIVVWATTSAVRGRQAR